MGDESRQPTFEELRVGFTAAVSHELRTPLARILALLESVPWEDRAVLGQLRDEIEQMRVLIDEILFLSELEEGHEVVALAPVPAMRVIRNVVDELTEKAIRAGIELQANGEDEILLPVRSRMLKVVVENLTINAIRYAGEGATCSITLFEQEGVRELIVADTGRGVPENVELDRLFERFYRADTARSSPGTGLGLAIVKHIVHAAGGTTEASQTPGGGLTVTCRFAEDKQSGRGGQSYNFVTTR